MNWEDMSSPGVGVVAVDIVLLVVESVAGVYIGFSYEGSNRLSVLNLWTWSQCSVEYVGLKNNVKFSESHKLATWKTTNFSPYIKGFTQSVKWLLKKRMLSKILELNHYT